jgi:hypothetical protein
MGEHRLGRPKTERETDQGGEKRFHYRRQGANP